MVQAALLTGCRYGELAALRPDDFDGEAGTITRIVISAPNDGDETFPMFYVKARRGTVLLHASEFAPAAEAAAQLWARRQIEALR